MSRSVTAELELDEGEYHVLMQVKATKEDGAFPVEEVVRKNAKNKRDKLLRIGLAYDLAHAKGHFNETEEEKKAKKLKEDKKKEKEKKELKEKLLKEKRRRKHVANKETAKERQARAKRAAKAKAKAARKAEKAKAAKAKEDAEKAKETKVEVKVDTSKDVAVSTDETKPVEIEVSTEDKATTVSEGTATEPTPAPEKIEAAAQTKEPAAEGLKPDGPPLLEVNGAPPSVLGLTDDEDDLDDESDLESVVSDISDGIIEEELAALKQAEKDKPEEPKPDEGEEEDEFQKDPWNAIVVVGLRVYSKGSCISVKVVRPEVADDDDEEKKGEKGEGKLDVDDSARDATKAEDKEVKKEEVVEEKKEVDEKKDGSVVGSEGSGVVV